MATRGVFSLRSNNPRSLSVISKNDPPRLKMNQSFLVTSLSIAAALSSQAAVVFTSQTSQTAGAAQSSVSGDLLQTSLSSSDWPVNNNINNGTTGAWNNTTAPDPANIAAGTFTFTLNTVTNPLGYDISQVNVFTGWTDGRAGQSYTLRFSVVGSSSFTDILTVNQTASNTGLVTRVFDDTGALLGTGVDQIQFVVNASGGLQSVYREIDVIPVPEPSVALIGGIGLLGLFTRRRRSA